MSLETLRKIVIVLLPTFLVTFAIMHHYYVEIAWLQTFYIVSLTANIGYFTNFVAIKMLFKPYEKTAFGRQGLIPKNQAKLAANLSDTIASNFFSENHWESYLTDSKLIETSLKKVRLKSRTWLLNSQNIHYLRRSIASLFIDNRESINGVIDQFKNKIVKQLSSTLEFDQLVEKGFAWLSHEFETNPEKMQSMIEPIIKSVAGNIPEISASLVKALDEHIEDQDTIKRGIAKMARWSTDISEEDIQLYLFRMVASFEFRETVYSGLKQIIRDYNNSPLIKNGDESKDTYDFSSIVFDALSTNLDNTDWVDLILEALNFDSEETLGKKDLTQTKVAIRQIHRNTFNLLEIKLESKAVQESIMGIITTMFSELDIKKLVNQQARAFSPQKIESVFQNMISEQLIFIELLGALLGALSGLALVDIRLLLLFSGLLGGFYLIDIFLTSRETSSKAN